LSLSDVRACDSGRASFRFKVGGRGRGVRTLVLVDRGERCGWQTRVRVRVRVMG
jgi:hypothetical protein